MRNLSFDNLEKRSLLSLSSETMVEMHDYIEPTEVAEVTPLELAYSPTELVPPPPPVETDLNEEIYQMTVQQYLDDLRMDQLLKELNEEATRLTEQQMIEEAAAAARQAELDRQVQEVMAEPFEAPPLSVFDQMMRAIYESLQTAEEVGVPLHTFP